MGDSVPKHTGPNSLTDTHPRTERLQNLTDHHQRESPGWKSLFTRELKLHIKPYLVVAGSNPNTSTSITVVKMDATTGALTDVSTGTLNNFINYDLIVRDPPNHVIYAMGENTHASQQN